MSFNNISPPFSDSDTDNKQEKVKRSRAEMEKIHSNTSSLEAERTSHHNRKHDDRTGNLEPSYRHPRLRHRSGSSNSNKNKSIRRKPKSEHTENDDNDSRKFSDSDDSADEYCRKEVIRDRSYKHMSYSGKSHEHKHHRHHKHHENKHNTGHSRDRYHEENHNRHHHHRDHNNNNNNNRSTNRTARKRRHRSLSPSSSSESLSSSSSSLSSSTSSTSSISSTKPRHDYHSKLKERPKRQNTSHKKHHSHSTHSAHHKTSRKEMLLKSEIYTLGSHAYENDDDKLNIKHEQQRSSNRCDKALNYTKYEEKNGLIPVFKDKADYSSAHRMERTEKYNLPSRISSSSSSSFSSSSSSSSSLPSLEFDRSDVECVPTSEWVCGVCSNLNSAQRTNCYRCGIAYRKSVATTQSKSIRISNVEQSEVNGVLEIIHNIMIEHKDLFASALDANVCTNNSISSINDSSNSNCYSSKDSIFALVQHYHDNNRKRLYLCLPSVAVAVNIMVYCKCQVELNSISLKSEFDVINKSSNNNSNVGDGNDDDNKVLEMLEEKKKICPLSFSHRCNMEKMCARSNNKNNIDKNASIAENRTVESETEKYHGASKSTASSFPAELAHDVWTPPTSFASYDAEKRYLEMLSANWTNLSSNQKNFYDEHVRKQLSLQVCINSKSADDDDSKTNNAANGTEFDQRHNKHSKSFNSQRENMKNSSTKQSTQTEAENTATDAIVDVDTIANNEISSSSNNNKNNNESKVSTGKTSSTLEDLKKRLAAKLQSKTNVKQETIQHEKKESGATKETTPFVMETADNASQESLAIAKSDIKDYNSNSSDNTKTNSNKNVSSVSKSSETLASITALKAKLLQKKKLLSKVEVITPKGNKAIVDQNEQEINENTASQSVDQSALQSEKDESVNIKATDSTNNDVKSNYIDIPQSTTTATTTSFVFLHNFPLPPCFSSTNNANYKIDLAIPHEIAQRLLPPR